MNWPLIIALLLVFGFVIGNIMFIKHAAILQMRREPPQTDTKTQSESPKK